MPCVVAVYDEDPAVAAGPLLDPAATLALLVAARAFVAVAAFVAAVWSRLAKLDPGGLLTWPNTATPPDDPDPPAKASAEVPRGKALRGWT